MNQFDLTMLAQVSAHRELLVRLYTHRLLDEPDPIGAARILREMLAQSPTSPPQDGSRLDPATSDLLAAMTDETVDDIMDRVQARLEQLLGGHGVRMPTRRGLDR